MNLLRYILTLPACCLGFFTALIAAIELGALIVRLRCPTRIVESSFCYGHPEIDALPFWLYSFGAALAAILMVVFPVAVSPGNKRKVAAVYFLIGAAWATIAVIGAGDTELLVPYSFALLSGLGAIFIVWRLTNQTSRDAVNGAPV